MNCPSCGAGVQADDVFCGSCGARVTAGPESAAPAPPPSPGAAPRPAASGPAGLGDWAPPPPRAGAAPPGAWAPSAAGQPGPQSTASPASSLSYKVIEPSLLGSLFDFDFRTMITPRLVKLLYVLVIVGAGFMGLGMLFNGLTAIRVSVPLGVFLILMAPVAFLATVVYGRVLLEFLVIFFKMGEEVSQIRERAFEE